ncbi:MAG: nitrite reductase [Nocardioidaceae bacterium]
MIRTAADWCPGVLRPWAADDGSLVRIRIPGGRLTSEALSALADVADLYADGRLVLTSRANLQLRAVGTTDGRPSEAFVDAVAAAGLLPSRTHDLVRNIVCSPLTGRVGGHVDMRPVLRALDEAIVSSDRLAELPGKFLFTLDDGSHDVAPGDLGAVCEGPERIHLVAGRFAVRIVHVDDVVPALVELALRFLDVRGSGPTASWHVRELPDEGRSLADPPGAAIDLASPQSWPLGPQQQRDGRIALNVSVPDGVLGSAQARTLAAASSGELVVTTERSVMLVDLSEPIPRAIP